MTFVEVRGLAGQRGLKMKSGEWDLSGSRADDGVMCGVAAFMARPALQPGVLVPRAGHSAAFSALINGMQVHIDRVPRLWPFIRPAAEP